jgi:hypothetical protein
LSTLQALLDHGWSADLLRQEARAEIVRQAFKKACARLLEIAISFRYPFNDVEAREFQVSFGDVLVI